MLVYDLTTSLPPPPHLALSPFELHRQPLAIIAIADGTESFHAQSGGDGKAGTNGHSAHHEQRYVRELDQELEIIRDRYPKALIHQLLVFDYERPASVPSLPDGLIAVPNPKASNITTMKTVMCDISSVLLAEMTTLAKSFQGMKSIDSPNLGQSARQPNGYSWSVNNDTHTSSPSPYSDPRGDSPTGRSERSFVRMSLPALRRGISDASRSDSDSRPDTPLDSSIRPEVAGPENRAISRTGKSDSFRQHSRDRISVQGFGSGSTSDVSRNKGKGRIGVVIGALYLNAGRWGDAIRELVEAATIGKANGDHLWHAKALELILVSMLMLAWAGHDFQIPQICYASAEKTPYENLVSSSFDRSTPSISRLVSLQNLCGILPELTSRVLNLYDRASNRAGESLPQLPFSENAVRFSRLLASVHLAGGILNDDALQHIVSGTEMSQRANVNMPRLNIHPTRAVVVATLLRAYPAFSSDDLSVIDHTIIFGAIASVFGELGYYRKKAMVMRELVSIIIPGLIQARLVGAAEMGIHPAAGLSALTAMNGNTNGTGPLELGEGDVESGIDDLLELIGQIYGVVSSTNTTHKGKCSSVGVGVDDADEVVIARIMRHAKLRAFGGQNMKMNVLRACINLSEALPDFQAALKFTSDLLRTAGSGVAPGPRTMDASPAMAREEQMRLSIIISRTVSTGRTLGLTDLAAEYWDEFLVRGVDLEIQTPSRTPIPHRATELGSAAAVVETKEINPFIFNPFLRSSGVTTSTDRLLVAAEPATFKVTLQNPYEFDLEIESIRLQATGVELLSAIQSTVIGPYRTQILTVSGTPATAGSMTITGCIIKVRGCRERRFPIFAEPWAPQPDIKIKSSGLLAVSSDRAEARLSTQSANKPILPPVVEPKPTSITVTVVDKQPVVVIKSSTLSQSAAMVLEGEQQTFSITLQNLSKTTAADLLLFSFRDSTQVPIQTALSNRETSPAELYEYELILTQKPALRWVPRGDRPPQIGPGETASFDFEILGKPGLTHAIVQVDYASLGIPVSEIKERFYTRQVSLPLTVTVNASVELVRVDFLPLSGSMPSNLWSGTPSTDKQITADEYCLVMMDLRNAWPSYLHVCLNVSDNNSIEEDILPGSTSRIIFPIKRIFLKSPYAAIPSLDPSRQRQFVVSTDRISPDVERSIREAFWYRESILKMLSGTWKAISGTERKGSIEMRAIRLSPRMIEALKIDPVNIELSIEGAVDVEDNVYDVEVDEFLSLKARITNRMAQPLSTVLRIQPSLHNHSHNSLDLFRKLVWNGTLQRTVPTIPANDSVELTFGLTALCRGKIEIAASVEEAQLLEFLSEAGGVGEDVGDQGDKTRSRASSSTFFDNLLAFTERRMWHTREPCIMVVRDDDSSSEEEEEKDEANE